MTMPAKEAAKLLRRHNEWRRGADNNHWQQSPYSPAELGHAIDAAVAALEAVPEGFVLVPVEPTAHMIEEGAKSIASWENGSIWPDSWGAMADQLRKDARTAYVSMVSESPERSNSLCEWVLTKDKDWQPSCTEEWARFKIIPASQHCPQCGRNISALLAANNAAPQHPRERALSEDAASGNFRAPK